MFVNDRDKMSNPYREPSINASYQVSVHLAKRFKRRRFLEIDQLETRIACGSHICYGEKNRTKFCFSTRWKCITVLEFWHNGLQIIIWYWCFQSLICIAFPCVPRWWIGDSPQCPLHYNTGSLTVDHIGKNWMESTTFPVGERPSFLDFDKKKE